MRKPKNMLAEHLRITMDERGLTAYSLGKASHGGIDQSYINRIRKGLIANPAPEKLRVLARAMGLPENELNDIQYGRTEEPTGNLASILRYARDLPDEIQEALLVMTKSLHREYADKTRKTKK